MSRPLPKLGIIEFGGVSNNNVRGTNFLYEHYDVIVR